jgi:pyruvate kinase
VATLGPASDTYETIRALSEAGADVFRLNMSHGTHDDIAARHAIIRRSRPTPAAPSPFWPTCRARSCAWAFCRRPARSGRRAALPLDLDPRRATAPACNCRTPRSFAALEPGASLLVNDGKIRLKVEPAAPISPIAR